MVRVELPASLCLLARAPREVRVSLAGEITSGAILDALEAAYPMLEGTIRDHGSKLRRPFIRFFVCGQDSSHAPPDHVLPPEIADGKEPFLIIGAIAGG